MNKTIYLVIFCFSLLSKGFTQQTTDLHQVFLAAESYYLFEEFEEALPLYLRIHRTNPDNYNLYFKIGVCYLNNPYERSKSVFYLEKAANNINLKYKDSNFKEMGAPLDALFFLGNAYRVANELDKARDSYKKFQSQMDPDIYDNNLVIEQLAACDVAEKLMKKPADMDADILSNQLNTRFADKNPAVSGDETKMVFISKLQFYDAIFYSEKKDGTWSYPRNITPELGVDGDVYPTCLSYDGTKLFIYRNDDFIGNIYTSTLVNGVWTPLEKLNELINTKYWESHASISKDGNTLYFTSNRKGGYGGLDVYKSNRLSDGDWGEPVNIGPSVNTPYNEETPFITENGRTLFFSSYGHYNMGGYDIFMSNMNTDSSWAEPVNIGYPLNTTDDDIFFCPVRNGEIGYFPIYKETGYGKHDIYYIHLYSANNPRRFDINGLLEYSGHSLSGADVSITALNAGSTDTMDFTHPDDLGKFTLKLPVGKYSLVFNAENFKKEILSLEVSGNTPQTGINLKDPVILDPQITKYSQEEIDQRLKVTTDTFLNITNDKAIEIEYEAEKGSTVFIRHYMDSELLKIDTIQIDKRRQKIEYAPRPGLSRIELTLTDKEGIQITKSIIIDYPETETLQQNSANLLPDIKEQEPAEQDKKGLSQENITALVNELSARADGKLATVLAGLDLNAENIDNTTDLFAYLYENAEKSGYSTEDVDGLMNDMIGKKDLGEFVSQLMNASEGPLKIAIIDLDPLANKINAPQMAVDYLVRNPKALKYKTGDIIKALAITASDGDPDNMTFLTRLIHSADEGPFKVYLKSINPASFKISSSEMFAFELYRDSTGKTFTGSDVLVALTNLAVNREAAELKKNLISLSDEGALKNLLVDLDLQKEGIYTTEELIAHIYSNADLKGYSHENVNHLLQKYLYSQVEEIDDLRLKMAALATGNLKVFLENTNLNDHSFGSREEFISYLNSESASNGFTLSDVHDTLLKLAYTGDQKDIIRMLINHSENNLKNTLENLDPLKEGIASFDELIRYLLDNSVRSGYSSDEVYQMLADYTAAVDMQLYFNKIIRLSDPETRIYLESLDLKANNILNREELISFLLKNSINRNDIQDKLIDILLIAAEIKPNDILSVLKSRSAGELNKFLNSGKLPVKNFNTGSDLYYFLVNSSHNNNSISHAEIVGLFTEYLINDALNQFLAELILFSDGKFRNFLQQVSLKDAGITSVSGLIQYLISSASQNGYTQDDIFMLIDKVLGHAKLADFMENLKEFAPPGLKKLLNETDLEKSGIRNIGELLKYISEHSSQFGYSMEDAWNSIMQLVISGEDKARDEQMKFISRPAHSLMPGPLFTLLIFGALGIIIFILALIRRRNRDHT